MSGNIKDEYAALFEAVLKLSSVEDCELFFADLLTIKELNSMAQRVQAARLLLKGATYEQIIKATDISSATLSRVSRCVKYGEGYKKVLADK